MKIIHPPKEDVNPLEATLSSLQDDGFRFLKINRAQSKDWKQHPPKGWREWDADDLQWLSPQQAALETGPDKSYAITAKGRCFVADFDCKEQNGWDVFCSVCEEQGIDVPGTITVHHPIRWASSLLCNGWAGHCFPISPWSRYSGRRKICNRAGRSDPEG